VSIFTRTSNERSARFSRAQEPDRLRPQDPLGNFSVPKPGGTKGCCKDWVIAAKRERNKGSSGSPSSAPFAGIGARYPRLQPARRSNLPRRNVESGDINGRGDASMSAKTLLPKPNHPTIPSPIFSATKEGPSGTASTNPRQPYKTCPMTPGNGGFSFIYKPAATNPPSGTARGLLSTFSNHKNPALSSSRKPLAKPVSSRSNKIQ